MNILHSFTGPNFPLYLQAVWREECCLSMHRVLSSFCRKKVQGFPDEGSHVYLVSSYATSCFLFLNTLSPETRHLSDLSDLPGNACHLGRDDFDMDKWTGRLRSQCAKSVPWHKMPPDGWTLIRGSRGINQPLINPYKPFLQTITSGAMG